MRRLFNHILHILDATPTEYGKERQRGQSFVELAFIMPILIIMIVGIAEIGWYANNYITVLEAAKVGARRGPFLTSEFAPQEFDPAAVIGPTIQSSGYDPLPDPSAAEFQAPEVSGNPRIIARGITNPRYPACEGVPNEALGFYNIIACTVLDSLDPLPFRVGKNEQNEPYKDDIVISAFSIQRVNNGSPGANNPETATPYDYNINTGTHTYPAGHQVVVVGRWPHNANECASGGVRHPGDYRDPFDYIVNNTVDFTTVISSTNKPVELLLELATPRYGNNGQVIGYTPFADVDYNENQRGFVWTGQHKITDSQGYELDCYGSEFSLKQVEDLFNLPNFVNEGASQQQRRKHLPSQGFVLVEVFWEHTLLLDDSFPIVYNMYGILNNLRSDDGRIIRVWAAFPAPAAEPAIQYQLNEDDNT